MRCRMSIIRPTWLAKVYFAAQVTLESEQAEETYLATLY